MKPTSPFVVSLYALLLSGCAVLPKVQTPALRVIPVAEWGGTPMSTDAAAATKRHVPEYITLHHGGVAFLRDKDPKQYLRNLQSWSRGTRKWADIPYHYLIDLDGNVYEGRDVNYAGDTNTEYDPTGHALIVVLGNFEDVDPNPAQLNAVTATMAMLAKRFNISPDKIAGHKDYSANTACPGKSLYPYLQNGYFQRQVADLLKP
ncbi:MAG: N-acetylmuramoyl-L-alanine amidase [Rhodocyclaceae bacterium]|nr:N-acetylmuramoyl-L-alanine amidase [Rhodocyclaceae bacterium]